MNKDTPPHSFNLSQDDLFQMNRVLRHRLRNHSAGMKMTLSAIEKELQAQGSPMAERCLLMKKELESLELMTERMDLVFADLPVQTESPLFQNGQVAFAGDAVTLEKDHALQARLLGVVQADDPGLDLLAVAG